MQASLLQHAGSADAADVPPAAASAATPAAASAPAFVINLCSSTTPVALSHPSHPELRRFTFFVSRRREDGRERFRLHMGYFASQDEAERLLDLVREIYPGAWAGLAPGQRLGSRAAAPAAPATAGAVAPAVLAAAQLPAAAAVAVPAAVAAAVPAPVPAQPVQAQPVPEEPAPVLSLVPSEPRQLSRPAEPTAAHTLLNVREVIATLADAPAAGAAPVLQTIPELQPVPEPLLDDAAALAVLESAAAPKPKPKPQPQPQPQARTGTPGVRPAVPAAAPRSAAASAAVAAAAHEDVTPRQEPACFAVQLMWSVQPIDINTLPRLAIFAAYTLYGAEGNRGGRRWYGLRLGFFTDALSARQVAQYVRSEFSSVSVVPVTTRERERARLAAGRPASALSPVMADSRTAASAASASAVPSAPLAVAVKPAAPRAVSTGGFQFIDDAPPAAASGVRMPGSAPGKRAKLRGTPAAQARPQVRLRKKAITLEETLEILGADQLEVDDSRKPLINDSGPSRRGPAKAKPSRLGRLFDRLTEKMGSD